MKPVKPSYIVTYQSGNYNVLELDAPTGFYYHYAETNDSTKAARIAAVLNRAEEN